MGHDPEQPGHRALGSGQASWVVRRVSGGSNEAVEAYRLALTVRTRDDLPQDWARTQNNLGNALRALGERLGWAGGSASAERGGRGPPPGPHRPHSRRPPPAMGQDPEQPGHRAPGPGRASGGPEGLRRLSEAVEAFRQALTVDTRDDLPQVLGHDPEQPGHSLQIQVRLGGFPAGLEQVDRLAQAEGIRDDPVAQASLRTLAIVCHVATHQDAEAGRAFASLVALVERQPADFHLVWDWTDLRDHLANSKAPPLPARREPLRKLLDAVSRDNNKAAILAGLKEVQAAFPARAQEPEIPIRQAPPQR